MLQLHDASRRIPTTSNAPRQEFGFPADRRGFQTARAAAMSGQFALEQTLYVDVEAMEDRGASPLGVLEKLTGRALV